MTEIEIPRKISNGDKTSLSNIYFLNLLCKSFRLMYNIAVAQNKSCQTPIPWTNIWTLSGSFWDFYGQGLDFRLLVKTKTVSTGFYTRKTIKINWRRSWILFDCFQRHFQCLDSCEKYLFLAEERTHRISNKNGERWDKSQFSKQTSLHLTKNNVLLWENPLISSAYCCCFTKARETHVFFM